MSSEDGVMDSKSKLTTEAGTPVGDNQNNLTAGPRGPVWVQNRRSFSKD
jgi:catalase